MTPSPQHIRNQPPTKPAGDATALVKLLAAQIVAEHFATRTAANTEPAKTGGKT